MATVVFDLDGTLADTSGDLIAAANACFRDLGHGMPLDPGADALTAFAGGRAMLRLGFTRIDGGADETRVDREFPKLIEHYDAHIDVHTRLYPGAADAVRRLRDAGVRTGICTNKPEALAVKLIDRLGVSDLFPSLIGADTLPTRKPDPAPYLRVVEQLGGQLNRSVLIGDTVTDRDTALAAGVACVLVAFGPEGDGVSRLDPDALLQHFDALSETVAPFIGL